MQVCTSLQTDKHASTPPLSFVGRIPFLPPNKQCQSTEVKAYLSAITVTNITQSFYLQDGGKKASGVDIEEKLRHCRLCIESFSFLLFSCFYPPILAHFHFIFFPFIPFSPVLSRLFPSPFHSPLPASFSSFSPILFVSSNLSHFSSLWSHFPVCPFTFFIFFHFFCLISSVLWLFFCPFSFLSFPLFLFPAPLSNPSFLYLAFHCIPKPRRLLPNSSPDRFYLPGTGLRRLSWQRGR